MYGPRHIGLAILAVLLYVGSLPPWAVTTAAAVEPCCEIVAIDHEKGLVTLRERATGKTYQVIVKEIRQAKALLGYPGRIFKPHRWPAGRQKEYPVRQAG